MLRLDGKIVSQKLREEIKAESLSFQEKYGVKPGLAVIVVGNDPASAIYVRNKRRACDEVEFLSRVYEMPEETSEDELIEKIAELNADANIHGILVQLPLPKHINAARVTQSILPTKDVDAFHPHNGGMLLEGHPTYLPCTPAGVMEILKHYEIDVAGKECVVVGRSNIVGKPMALLLLAANGTVTICHSKTADLAEVTRRADILVSAIGKARFITPQMVKPGAVVIDVGINRDADSKLCGDVDYDGIAEIAFAATPVPGGVGPMTITMLLQNTLTSAKSSQI